MGNALTFKDLKIGEGFGTHDAYIQDMSKPYYKDRPCIYIKCGADKALFLPTGEVREFSSNKRVHREIITIASRPDQ